MKTAILIIQIIFAILLVLLILLQGKGAGLNSPLGSIGVYSTRRGVEKIVYYATIATAFLFFLSSLIQLLIG